MKAVPKLGKNIYLRKDGRWEGRYSKGRVNGKLKYGYIFGKTREEVEETLEQVHLVNFDVITTSSSSFTDVSSEWLNSLRPQLKISSPAKYHNILNSY